MGIIEDSIFAIYRKALEEGNISQAKKCVDLAKVLKHKIEEEGFVDHPLDKKSVISLTGNFFEPHTYRYYPDKGVVVLANSAISLTQGENKLFYLFSLNESQPDNIRIITKTEIHQYLWASKVVTPNSVRISVLRLRRKIGVDQKDDSMLVSVYGKGYVFFGKRLEESE